MDYGYLTGLVTDILVIIGSVLFVVFFFGMCIFVHELGHFMVAKWRGLHIDAFSIGFKTIWKKKVNGIEYRLGCLPLGGYVELPQVDSATDKPKAADGTELPRAKPIDRILTAAAGPICNIIFGLLLGCIVWVTGIPQDTPKMRTIEVAQLDENSPEYAAGLRVGDRIVKLNGKSFNYAWKDFVVEILTNIGDVTLTVERDGEYYDIVYTPAVNPNHMTVEKTAYPFFLPRIPIEFYPMKGSPAEKANIQPGDILLSINGKMCQNFGELQSVIDFFGDKPLALEMRSASTGEIYNVEVQADDIPDELNSMSVYYTGITLTPEMMIAALFKDFPAGASGLLPGDVITHFNGEEVKDFPAFFDQVQAHGETEFKLTILRNGQAMEIVTRAKAVRPRTIGVEYMLRDYPNPFNQFVSLIELTAKSIRSMATKLGNTLGLTEQQSNLSARNMSGPMGMAVVLYRSVQVSPVLGIYFVVMISFALAIFNLLPLPVLDGGHVFIALLEIIFRRPMPVIVIKVLSYTFVGLLIALMIYVTYMDILRVLPQGSSNTEEVVSDSATQDSAE